ncbi:hypothetical protein OKW42_008157 [Paraburkholderia sp. WC7.3d]
MRPSQLAGCTGKSDYNTASPMVSKARSRSQASAYTLDTPGVTQMSPLNFLNLKNSEVQVEGQTDVFCRIEGAGAGEGRRPVSCAFR